MDPTIDQVLQKCGLFFGLEPAVRQPLVEMALRKKYRRGQSIFHQGQPCPGIFIVQSGMVRVYKSGPNGREHVLHMVSPGQTFAEVAAIGNFALPANAQASTAATCVLLPTAALQKRMVEDHLLCRQMLTGMSFWVRHFVQLMEDIVLRDAVGRVARYILDQAQGGEKELSLPGLKKDLASHLNLTSETLSRVLRRMDEQGLIASKGGRKLRVLNTVGLHALMQGE